MKHFQNSSGDKKLARLHDAIVSVLSPGTAFEIQEHRFPKAVVACTCPGELIGRGGSNVRSVYQNTGWRLKVVQLRQDLAQWIKNCLGPTVRFEIEKACFPDTYVNCTVPTRLIGLKAAVLKQIQRETGWRISKVSQLVILFRELQQVIRKVVPPEAGLICVNRIEDESPQHGFQPGIATVKCRIPSAISKDLCNRICEQTGYLVDFVVPKDMARRIVSGKFSFDDEPELTFDEDSVLINCKGPPPEAGSYVQIIRELRSLTGYQIKIRKKPVAWQTTGLLSNVVTA